MKKVIWILLVGVFLIVSLTACGGQNNEGENPSGKEFFMSEDFYFTLPNPENLVTNDRGTVFNNNILHIIAELNVPKSEFEVLARAFNAEITSYLRCEMFGDEYTFTFTELFTYEELQELSKELEQIGIIQEVVISRPMTLTPRTISEPSDPRWENNWGMRAVNAPNAWYYRGEMEYINTLVLDSSFYGNHEDLEFASLLCFYPWYLRSYPHHGTHVAGIIGATWNDRGVSGIAPNSYQHLHGVQVAFVNDDGDSIFLFDEYGLMRLIRQYIIYEGVKVINFSMGSNLLEFAASRENGNAIEELNRIARVYERHLQRLINSSHEFVIVTSAGNQHENNAGFIADGEARFGYRQIQSGESRIQQGVRGVHCAFARIQNQEVKNRIIVVGAVDHNLNLASFSQREARVDVTAPGVDIYSTHSVTTNRWGRETHIYEELCGTSMSAPFVSGLATMIFGINPDLRGDEVKDIIVRTADEERHHMINAGEAVREAIETTLRQPAIDGAEAGIALQAYGELLAQYREAGQNRYFLDVSAFVIRDEISIYEHPNMMLQHIFEEEPSLNVYYTLFDIDQNGIPELLIGIGTNENNIDIYAIFTWVDGQVYYLTGRARAGSGYQQITIHDNGIIVRVSVGHGGNYWSFQRISTDGNILTTWDNLFETDPFLTGETLYYIDGVEEPIVREGFEALIRAHIGQIPREGIFGDFPFSYRVLENGVVLNWNQFMVTPAPAEEVSADDTYNWQEWFATPYGDWGNRIEFLSTAMGGTWYRLVEDGGNWITIGFSGEPNASSLPVTISVPVSKVLGGTSTSVEELRRLYGNNLRVAFDEIMELAWFATVYIDGYRKTFLLESENDTNITQIRIDRVG